MTEGDYQLTIKPNAIFIYNAMQCILVVQLYLLISTIILELT